MNAIEEAVRTIQQARSYDEVQPQLRSLAFRAGIEDEWEQADDLEKIPLLAKIEKALNVYLEAEPLQIDVTKQAVTIRGFAECRHPKENELDAIIMLPHDYILTDSNGTIIGYLINECPGK